MNPDERIAAVTEVPADSTLVFTVTDRKTGVEHEAILIRTDAGIRCWLNYCRHLTHIRLDKGTGALVRGPEIICTNHGAMFRAATGYCTHGPCQGAYLERLDITVADGSVYLTDDQYTFAKRGPITTDVDDLSSTSNLEF